MIRLASVRGIEPGLAPAVAPAVALAMALAAILLVAQIAGMVSVGVLGGLWSEATPLTALQYAVYYGDLPHVRQALYIGLALALAACAAPVIFFFAGKGPEPLHGAARWAGQGDLKASGLLGGKGIIVGKRRGRFLLHDGSGSVSPHVFLAAPTGSGKTQGVMLPNAYAWPGSLVVLDIKGELFAQTAGFRAASGQAVYRLDFSPLDGRSHCYNPFTYVSRAPDRLASDIRRIADQLITESKPDPIWSNGARQLFVAAALYLYGINEEPTLPRLRAVIDIPEGFRRWCSRFVQDAQNIAAHHPECVIGFGRMANGPEEAMLGMLANLQEALNPLVNAQTVAVLSGSSFDLRDLRTSRMSIYVTAQPKDQSQYGPLLRLFFQQLIDVNADVEFSRLPASAAHVLIGLDEFAALGPLPAIERGITVVRSYGIRLLAIVQSPAQLTTLYGREGSRTFTDNFGAAVFYTPGARDLETAEELSRLLGYATRKVKSLSRPKHALFDTKASESTSEQRRALLLPQEIMSLPGAEAIVRIAGMPPIRVGKILAATDAVFASRRRDPPAIPRLKLPDLWAGHVTGARPFPSRAPQVGAASDRAGPVTGQGTERVAEAVAPAGVPASRSNPPPAGPVAAADSSRAGWHAASDFDVAQLEHLRAADFDLMFRDVQIPDGSLDAEAAAALVEQVSRSIFDEEPDPARVPKPSLEGTVDAT